MSVFFTKVKSFFNFSKQDLLLLFTISGSIVFCDLLTKYIVFSLKENFIYILPIFNIVKVNNFGVSFGLFSENPDITFYFILIFDFFVMIYLLHCIKTKHEYIRDVTFNVGINFVIGGAIGNFIDRIYTGSVRDFLDFHLGSSHWPCFNVADIFICIGVVIWIICELFYKKK